MSSARLALACVIAAVSIACAVAACGASGGNAPGGAGGDSSADGFAPGDAAGEDSTMQTGDAGADGAGQSGDGQSEAEGAAPGDDSGLTPDPGAITCGATTCPDASGDPPMNQVRAYCCVQGPNTGNSVSQTCEFANLGACESGDPYYCDETADCNQGLFCCMSDDLRAWTACQSSCTGVMLCKSTAECINGMTCMPVTCDGQHLGTCGPLPAKLAQAFGCQ